MNLSFGKWKMQRAFFDCAGIESPGLTSAPAIGEMVAQILKEKMNLEEKRRFYRNKKKAFWIRIHSARKKEWN